MNDWWDVVGGEERLREAALRLRKAFEAAGPFQVAVLFGPNVQAAEDRFREIAALERLAADLRPMALIPHKPALPAPR